MSDHLILQILLSALVGVVVSRRLVTLLSYQRVVLIGIYLYYVSFTVATIAALQFIWYII